MNCTRVISQYLTYEWDSLKDETNRKKHGISLEFAINAFDDPHGVYLYDKSHSIGEERLQYIGAVSGKMLIFVVITERKSFSHTTIRLISARKATQQEKLIYVEHGR